MKYLMQCLILIIVAFLVSTPLVSAKECGENEEWSKCGTSCSPTCRNIREGSLDIVCVPICVPMCICKAGYVYDSDSVGCVAEEECLTNIKECGKNEVWLKCASPCAPTCRNLIENTTTLVCDIGCVPMCTCKKDYVYDDDSQGCIPFSDCLSRSED